MSQTNNVNQDEQYLELARLSDAVKTAAAKEIASLRSQLAVYQESHKRAHALIDETLEALVQHERIIPEARKEAAELIRDPENGFVNVMKVLKRAADPDDTIRPSPVGKGQGATKEASAPVSAAQKASEAFDRAFYQN